MPSRARLLALGLAVLAAGCAGESTGPAPFDEPLALVPEFAESMAAEVDAAGIGGAGFPDELRLTAEQKAAIAALHEAFKAAIAADVEALRAIEAEARAARQAGKSREEIRAILAPAIPILARIHAAYEELRADIWAVYTPEQRAWIESHRPICRPGDLRLTEGQIAQIRALQQAFLAAIHDDLAVIKAVVQEAREAAQNGATREEIHAILARADQARENIRQAELRLRQAILDILTPEQRTRRCPLPRPSPG